MSVWIVYRASSKNPMDSAQIFDSQKKAEDFRFDLYVGLRINPEEIVIAERQVF